MAIYDYLNQPVMTSLLCFQRDADSFFSPVALAHTGFAADGYHYTAGAKNQTQQASWFTESLNATRGPLPEFPTQALVIVNRASLAILDATTDVLELWMLFYLADQFAFCDNALDNLNGYLATAVTWANGLLSITLSPDAGSASQAVVVVTVDLVQDAVYADTPVTPSGSQSQ